MKARSIAAAAVLVALATVALSGCGRPNVASIQVRKENQALRSEIADLQRAVEGYRAQIRSLEANATTVPTLPRERLDELFTTHGLDFGRLTGGADFDPDQPGDEGLKVYAVPTDAQGQPLKAAGSFVVEAFDLSRSEDPLIGRWEYPLEQATEHWYGRALLYTYVLPAKWQEQVPQSDEVTIRVTFTDALTGRTFTEQQVVKVNPPA